jgi:hypothetical protein
VLVKKIICVCMLFLACAAAIPARAAGRLAEVMLIDRDTGQQLEAYYRYGQYWVAGEPGAHYAIYLRNRLGERLLAVTSVDGINAITGQNAGWDQSGYVLDPWEGYQITGWRKSDYQVAAFAFTAAPRSYAARTGRPDNVGVIGIALFREQPVSSALAPPPPQIANRAPESAPRAPPPPAAERAQREAQAQASAPAESRSSDLAANGIAAAPSAQAPALGTAHGQREYSYVAHTAFVRRHWQPDEIIRIRYDSLDNLIAMGIVRPHHYSDLRPSPFPSTDNQSYVPDPPPYDATLPR